MPILTAEERVGTVLGGRYRIEEILGAGGTATVYRAVHTFTNRSVALKILKPEHGRDRGLVARFLKEARIASTVSHPNVVAILDMGTAEDCTYLAMELLHGESLAARLATVGAMPADEVIRLLRPLMEAVVVAHDKGIVHRDIKPDNVLVGDRGDGVTRAVLLDFGMAKTNEAAWGHMTQSGVLVGTPYYMSPEQAEGAPDIGPATDVWSTGVMMYRALSGDLPFSASTPTALLLSIARGDHMPLSTRAPSVPAPIAAWVEGAIVVDRQKRYPDIRAMLAALDEALAGVVRPSRPDLATSQIRPAVGSSPRMPAALPVRSRAPMAIGAAVLALAAAMGAFFHFQASGPVAAPMPPTPVVAETGPEIVPTEPPPAPEAEAGEATTETSATETATDTVTEAAAATTPRTGREGRGARGGRGRDGTRGASASSGTGATTGSTSSGGSGLLTEW